MITLSESRLLELAALANAGVPPPPKRLRLECLPIRAGGMSCNAGIRGLRGKRYERRVVGAR